MKTIARNLVKTTDTGWNTNIVRPNIIDGFILREDDSGYTVTDGTTTEHFTNPADALACYIDFIEAFIDDQPTDIQAIWKEAIDQARADLGQMTASGYQVVRDETPAANLPGAKPYVLAANPELGAHLLERRSDGRQFLLIGATTHEAQAVAWVQREIEAGV